uniref:Thiopeptide-type bacteriocin biosynthesis domain-containing protein n=1 Tax=Streptomyces sp. NBC_01401 TaxID=2903854 RepID=A0AAU3GU96_9ACTN
MKLLDHTDETRRDADMDWWYVRAYPGHPDLMDEAALVLLPWLAEQAAGEHARAWFFTRYWDMSGHHLRLRLHCPADGADRVHARLPELLGLLHSLGRPRPADRLVPGSTARGLPLVKQALCCLYSPELAKYGGRTGVARTEELFTASCRWYVDERIGALDPLYDRAALAVTYMRALVRAALPEASRADFWTAHRRQWGRQLRMAAPQEEELRRLLSRASKGTAEAAPGLDDGLGASMEMQVAAVVRTLEVATADGNPVPRPVLLLHYLHMDMNRWGFVPAEECLLGVLASS